MKASVINTQPPEQTPVIEQALGAIERGDFQHSIDLLSDKLEPHAQGDAQSRAQVQALLGLANLRLERYAAAALAYERALALAPLDGRAADWRAMLALAQANAISQMATPLPDVYYFDREALLAPASLPPGALPGVPPPAAPLGLWRVFLKVVGQALGAVGTLVFELAMNVYGRLAGYRDEVWTNWYHRPQLLALLTLAYMREKLNAHNLGTSYPAGRLVAFQAPGQVPPPGASHYRCADGSWNSLTDPKAGAAGTRFLRNVASTAIRPEFGEQLLTPNPREISLKLLSRPDGPDGEPVVQEVPFLNLLAASWIQFMNHDWVNHGEIVFTDTIDVPLPADDVARRRYWQTKMFIGRSQPDPTRCNGVEEVAYSAINEVTHWWDGSQIYGSDQATQDRLRSHVGGKMRLGDDARLPMDDSKGVEDTGFRRNWWVGLSMLHTLFVREHNAICDELATAYPDWEDARLFQVARLINAAVMAKIHTIEWTPAILPNPALDAGMHANWYGLVESALRKGNARRTMSEIKIENPELGGVVGNPLQDHGRRFGLTEEFVEVYRLHSLLPEKLQLRRLDDAKALELLALRATRQAGSVRTTDQHAMADLFFSFGNQHPGKLVLNNFPRFMQELSIPGNPFFDMGTVDIVRARERGVPRYNEFRRQLGLNAISRFEDLSDDAEQVEKLKRVYGRNPADVEKIDLLIGTLSEGHRPTFFGFGETMFQIFILNATRRLQADRFYSDCFNDEYYTPEGLRWIDATDFKAVLLRHYPQLADTGLANIKNAFEPWDSGPELDPTRHPLRACDNELAGEPWRGQGYAPFKRPS